MFSAIFGDFAMDSKTWGIFHVITSFLDGIQIFDGFVVHSMVVKNFLPNLSFHRMHSLYVDVMLIKLMVGRQFVIPLNFLILPHQPIKDLRFPFLNSFDEWFQLSLFSFFSCVFHVLYLFHHLEELVHFAFCRFNQPIEHFRLVVLIRISFGHS